MPTPERPFYFASFMLALAADPAGFTAPDFVSRQTCLNLQITALMSTQRYFEDFSPGGIIPLASRTIDAAEIIEFASEFDPQPFHLDEEAGRRSILGGLASSGWMTCAVTMRMIFDDFLKDSASMGSPGITSVQWRRPVLAGDTLSGLVEVLSVRRSSSKPQMGIVTFRITLTNQKAEVVMVQENPIMFECREATA